MWLQCCPAPVCSGSVAWKGLGIWAAPAGRPLHVAERLVGGGQCVGDSFHPPPDPPSGLASVIVSIREVMVVDWVNGPEVTLAIVAASSLDKALVQGKIVSDTVPPVLVLLQRKSRL